MTPLHYEAMVVRIKQNKIELEHEIERVRKLGLENWANVADPKKRSRPGVWYHHVDPGVNPYFVSDAARGDDDICAC